MRTRSVSCLFPGGGARGRIEPAQFKPAGGSLAGKFQRGQRRAAGRFGEIAAEVDAGEVKVLFIGAADEITHDGNRAVGDDGDAGGRLHRADVAGFAFERLDDFLVGGETECAEQFLRLDLVEVMVAARSRRNGAPKSIVARSSAYASSSRGENPAHWRASMRIGIGPTVVADSVIAWTRSARHCTTVRAGGSVCGSKGVGIAARINASVPICWTRRGAPISTSRSWTRRSRRLRRRRP